MSLDRYFTKLPKGAPLPISWKPSAQPPTKRPKRGPGRPIKIREPQAQEAAIIVDSSSDSEREREDESSCGSAFETSETAEVEKGRAMKRLYSMKQKKAVVAYVKMHSVAAAARHFTIPRTTIARWMVDKYFTREVTKRGVKKGAG